MSFAENLRELIKICGITTKELAAQTGINENTIRSYLKTNGSIPTADKAVEIAKALHTSVEFLVTGFEKENFSYKMSHNYKFSRTITSLEKIPENTREPILKMIAEISQKFSKS